MRRYNGEVTWPGRVSGALWALAYSAGLASWTDSELRRAATIQEMFDVRLYGISWNNLLVGDAAGAASISRLSTRFHGRDDDMIHNYYEIPDFPGPYDILACQMTNVTWGPGSSERQRFLQHLRTAVNSGQDLRDGTHARPSTAQRP